jgi:hypothetical protein
MRVGGRNCWDYFDFADTRAESTHLIVGKGRSRLDLAAVLKKKVQPGFAKDGIIGVGWHTFRHTFGTMLAEMGEHQLTIRDYLRHSNLHGTNKYLQATSQSKRLPQGQLVDSILPGWRAAGEQINTHSVVSVGKRVPEFVRGRVRGGILRRSLDPNGPR